jgi:hypothetical protein
LIAVNPRYRGAILALESFITENPTAYPLATEEQNGIAAMRIGPSEPFAELAPFSIYFTIDSQNTGTFWGITLLSVADLTDNGFV